MMTTTMIIAMKTKREGREQRNGRQRHNNHNFGKYYEFTAKTAECHLANIWQQRQCMRNEYGYMLHGAQPMHWPIGSISSLLLPLPLLL